MRRARIVCTLGPVVNATDRPVRLTNARMNVARLNMSRGDYDEHEGRPNAVREAIRIAGRTAGVLADFQGPKIRLSRFVDGQKHYLERGGRSTITIEGIPGTKERCSTIFKGLPGDVKSGDQVLIGDGKAGLRTLKALPTEMLCEMVIVGPVPNNKGINLSRVVVSVPATGEKDERDPRWALLKDIDIIALSFVRSDDGIKRVHKTIEEEGHRIPVIMELEKPQAITNP